MPTPAEKDYPPNISTTREGLGPNCRHLEGSPQAETASPHRESTEASKVPTRPSEACVQELSSGGVRKSRNAACTCNGMVSIGFGGREQGVYSCAGFSDQQHFQERVGRCRLQSRRTFRTVRELNPSGGAVKCHMITKPASAQFLYNRW